MPKVGDVAPAFRVKDHTGRERSLSEFKGKRVVLWFFPKADTPGCTVEGCGFRDRAPDYEAKGAQVLGISFDTPAENKAFVEKFHFPFPILCDVDRSVGMAYGVAADAKAAYPKRATFVIGPDGKVEQAIEKVDVKTHPGSLLESLPAPR